jgi:uncharacterized protein
MTPAERQLVTELFDRLAALEDAPRDRDAEKVIRDGLAQAPNAVYALVQTALVQDETLKQADARIQELEAQLAASNAPQQRQGGGFLDNMRDSIWGRQESRGSVPTVRSADAPMGTPPGFGGPQGGPGYGPQGGPGYGAQGGYGPQGQMPPPPPEPSRGGSFLGTAAAAAAGAIGGSLLLNSIRGMTGGGSSGGGGHALADQSNAGGGFGGGSGGGASPWGNSGGGGELSRQAGIDDIGRNAGSGPIGQNQAQGAFNDAGGDHGNYEDASVEDSDFDLDDSGDFGDDGGGSSDE